MSMTPQSKAAMSPRQAQRATELIQKWFKFFYDRTESFYPDQAGALGAELGYLFAAMADATIPKVYITDDPGSAHDSVMLKILKEAETRGDLSASDKSEIYSFFEIDSQGVNPIEGLDPGAALSRATAGGAAEGAGAKPYTVVGRYLNTPQMWTKQVYANDPDEAEGLAIIELIKSNDWDSDPGGLRNWLCDIQVGETFEGHLTGVSPQTETGLITAAEHELVRREFGWTQNRRTAPLPDSPANGARSAST